MTERPLRLPHITLLFGHPPCGAEDLARSIAELDTALRILDVNNPLEEASDTLFLEYGVVFSRVPKVDVPLIPSSGYKISSDDWITNFRRCFLDTFGENALARLTIARMKEHPVPFERYVILGIRRVSEVEAFVKEFREPRVLTINCGPLSGAQIPGEVIHLPHRDAKERMTYLRHERGELFD